MDLSPDDRPALRSLRREILAARQRVYAAGSPTPLERLVLENKTTLLIKREDLSPIKAYKWRGAYNRMAVLSADQLAAGVITASAGNHAQGVALAARLLGCRATIFMPRSTPQVKQDAVREQGGDRVTIKLHGDAYDDALSAALEESKQLGLTYIHAYDDPLVMAGQGTLADEIATAGTPPIDVAFLQIGGGGLAAGVGAWLKLIYPKIKLIAVEGVGQACYQAAAQAGHPVRLAELDLFCDGTAVREIGHHPFELLPHLIDESVTVTNEEVTEAIRFCWNRLRCIPEPSGAMGLAAYRKNAPAYAGKTVLTLLCGANMDFGKLGLIASQAGSGQGRRFHWEIPIPERPGAMLALLEKGIAGTSIHSFLYGKVDAQGAWPIFGFCADDPEKEALATRLRTHGYTFREVGEAVDVQTGTIPYRPDLFSHPAFLLLDFYERPGALYDFLDQTIRGKANFCFFQYHYSGERIGRALIGLEFSTPAEREHFLAHLPASGQGFRRCARVDPDTTRRLLAKPREEGEEIMN